jgi:tRNA threonylcarbamoyladenosine modification (KEOPS) complex Cgi121 subunit
MSKIYHTLDSEKYFTATLLADKKLARMQANKTIKTMFVNCMIVIATSVAAFYAIKTMPMWLPTFESAFHQFTNYKYA